MTPTTTDRLKKLLIVPAVLVGVAVLVFIVERREQPAQVPPAETVRTVRVIAVPAVEVVPRAVGYGYVTPAKVWEAVAEVSGRIIEMHPRLDRGEILPRGAVLLRIDPTDYQLAIAEVEANIQSAKADLLELAAREANARLSLEIEEKSLELSLKDLERKHQLLKRGNVSQAAVDEQERLVLTHRQNVQAHRNILNLVPAERAALAAKLTVFETQLEGARRDLQRTTISAPFDVRVADVKVELAQFAKDGQVLVVADGIDIAEVAAQLPIDKFRILLPRDVEREGLTIDAMDRLPSLLRLGATVRLRAGDVTVDWTARFERISDTIDPETRTVGVIVAVDEPYTKARIGVRPPLVKNMFVEVELRGPPIAAKPVIPRAALVDGSVYVVNADDRLEKRPVQVALAQTNFIAIEQGLEPGERVVVSDLVPAIEGMRLEAIEDAEIARRLVAEAQGRSALR